MDLGEWLKGLGLGQYEATFREHEIDADVLPDLTEVDLEKIGLPLGARKRLMKGIAGLASKEATPSAEAPAPPPKTSARVPLQQMDLAERRPITVMFCDLVGSTALASRLDAEDWRSLVNAYLDEASAAVTGLGGHVLKRLGDGLMVLFGYPQAQENDAERAVRAALAIQRALADINAGNAAKSAPELSVRIGIESGPVVVEAAGEVFGDAPNIAARVETAAEPGTVLITASVQRQVAGLFVVEDKGAQELKGLATPVTLYRVVRVSGGRRRTGARVLTPFIGREDDLNVLARRWERARSGTGQFVLVVGEPGLGKSRLIEEFHVRLGETPHTWVEWSSSQLLQNTPLHPLAEWGRIRFGGADVAPKRRLADLESTLAQVKLDVQETATLLAPLLDIPLPLGRNPNLPPEELRRRQLAATVALLLAGAKMQPVVLAFEDLHWADPTSLDLLRALAERGEQAPLFVVATARPEFRPPWTMRSHHGVIALAPLDRAQVARMVGEIAAQHALPQNLVDRVGERTGGVPLFVEEVTRLLLERGEQGGVQAIPPTLQQSLAARLDRLGPAREVAQIGAVLGRDFTYSLLRDVKELDESSLQASLERLAEADLLFVEGAPPQANYRFKHALIQDAAYESLLKSRRQALHRRAAKVLRDDPERAAAEPEVIAHHFTAAGLDACAIEWWGKAGDQALRRSAFQEAIAHLGKAIAMADKATGAALPHVGGDAATPGRRVKLQTDFAHAVLWSKGYGADETKAAFQRTGDLATGLGLSAERLPAYYGQFAWSMLRGDIRAARGIAEDFLREAQADGGVAEIGVAHRVLGLAYAYLGDLAGAQSQLELALNGHDHELDSGVRERFGFDSGVATRANLAYASCLSGDLHRARRLIEEAISLARELAHLPSTMNALVYKGLIEIERNDLENLIADAETLLRLSQQHGMEMYAAWSRIYLSWARARLGEARQGAADLRESLAAFTSQGNQLGVPGYLGLLAELEAAAGNAEGALTLIDNGLATAQEGEQHYADAFLYRLRGDILLKRDPTNPAPAEEAYRTAIVIAKQQAARSFELRAALSLAKLYRSTGRPADAHAALALALEGFAPTPEMPEIAEAQALLAALAESGEVKATLAQQQRRRHLQVAYGNALFAARGPRAQERMEAFAKARESAHGGLEPERLVADWGLWAGSYARGELLPMRAHAEAFLNNVGARPDSPEAGVAHRAAGMTHWFAGEYRQARQHLERALALFQAGRDDDLAFRFGQDAGIAAMLYLALALWPLGEVDRAASLVADAQARAAGLAHIGTHAYANMHVAMFELMCGDLERAAPNGIELARLTRDHDLPMWRAYAVFLDGLAKAESGGPRDGLEGMRSGTELLPEQNLAFDGLIKIVLAEAEARAGDADRALAILDEGLATCERTGHRSFEAELHRVRGEMVVKRDAPAEGAYLAAIEVAKHQGARSFRLRAALSLAKLYQSTARPVEAHAVLAPALEGISPTPEMPEIAEAQALLAALAEADEVKAEAARRQQRRQLHVAYGNALIAARGYGAPETTEAFAKVRKSVAGNENAPELLSADYGLWVGARARAELSAMKDHSTAFLNDVAANPDSPEAGVAHRIAGITHWFAGEYLEAREHLEQALALFQPGRDDDLTFRFGHDAGVAALAYLAFASWPLGEIDRAILLVERMQARVGKITHVNTLAYSATHAAMFALMSGDRKRAQTNVSELAHIVREHDLPVFRVFGVLFEGWAAADVGALAEGLEGMRRAVGLLRDQSAEFFDGLIKIALAEAEARAGDVDRALAVLDEALAICDRKGFRAFEAELHRVRGEMLLKYDPADPAPAVEALGAAITVAKRQGARSFELRAALSLAKLYRSTGRPADAHAVLAPALEGFAPTPEMPEMAEAMSLSARLA